MLQGELVGAAPRARQPRVITNSNNGATPPALSPDQVITQARTATCAAVALGWQAAQLYLSVGQQASAAEAPSDELPSTLGGRGSLSADDRLGVMQIHAGVVRLAPALNAAGLYDKDLELPANFADRDGEQRRRDITTFNEAALLRLYATDFRIGKGYTLGRALSNLSLAPPLTPGDASFEAVQCKLLKVCYWVQDLRSVLPDHAAKPVLDGVNLWRAWLQDRALARRNTGDPGGEAVEREVKAALRRQGVVWRALLSGEKSATDVLSAQSYFDAGQTLIYNYRRMLTSFLRHWWPYAIAVGAALSGIIAVLLVFGGGTAGAIGAAATALAAIGVTGKTISTAVTNAVAPVERSLAEAEIDTAVGLAATRLPFDLDPRKLAGRSKRQPPIATC